MPHRLYLDETGDHTSSHATDVGKRYLGLVGVSFNEDPYKDFAVALEQFKREHLKYHPDDPPILHRKDILYRSGCFSVLRDPDKQDAFDAGLLKLIEDAQFRIIAVVIDKWQHSKAYYRSLKHPYHYCLHAMLERYCGYLRLRSFDGDVMAESRGKKEDMALKLEYEQVWENGTRYMKAEVPQATLTSKRLKVKPKEANVAGLQLADILAHPLTRRVLSTFNHSGPMEEGFAKEVCRVAHRKLNKQEYTGRTKGYGQILLD